MGSAVDYNKSRPYSRSLWYAIQRRVGARCDGRPGRSTADLLSAWQGATGLSPDGMAGPATLRVMGLREDLEFSPRTVRASSGCPVIVDLSKWQGEIDWSALAPAVDGVILKSTEGRRYVDPKYEHNLRAARAAGVAKIGAYHLLRPVFKGAPQCPISAGRDAAAAISGRLELGLWLDLETVHAREAVEVKSAAWLASYICRVAREVDRLTGDYPGIYWSGRGRRALGEHAVVIEETFREWDVRYIEPRLPTGQPERGDLWQIGSTGEAPGVDGCVDINIAHPEGQTWTRALALCA